MTVESDRSSDVAASDAVSDAAAGAVTAAAPSPQPSPRGGEGEAAARSPEPSPRGEGVADAPTSLAGAIEAVLYMATEPLTQRDLERVFVGEAKPGALRQALAVLKARYAGRPDSGMDVVDVAGGVRLLTRPVYARHVERLDTVEREERLSRAALETLAVVAYRQPILRADIDSIRGVDSSSALGSLIDKGLVKAVGTAPKAGHPFLYGTAGRFLKQFGLASLRDLPRERPLPYGLKEVKEPGEPKEPPPPSPEPSPGGRGSEESEET